MSFWNKAKNSALKVKIQGEIKLLEREANVRKKKFGVEFYDLLTNDKKKLLGVSSGVIFQGKQAEVKEPFDRARDDINGIQVEKDEKQRELDILEVKGAHTLPNFTAQDKVKKAGRHVTDAGKSAKIQAEMALLDRKMKIRKEAFGLEVFELATASEDDSNKGIKGAVKSAISNVAQQEKDIQACIDEAKNDVALIEGKIKSKGREINLIEEEMNPLVT